MEMRLQPVDSSQQQRIWLRVIAVLCLMLVCLASTAQACHTHADLASASKDSRQNSTAPDHCPLCVAMHSAMPTAAHTAHGMSEVAEQVILAPMVERLGTIWVFELQTRPPPIA